MCMFVTEIESIKTGADEICRLTEESEFETSGGKRKNQYIDDVSIHAAVLADDGQVYGGGLGPVVPNCPMNEYWSACGRNCDETCTIQYPLCRYIMFFPTCRREPGCTCASNYVRNSYSGACVPRSTC
ncbi:uncharacterized protein LOC143377498 isoform X1 [Andrena cerasifolii]|uniref:uncharacterized protein LOC143377498 isoform X1 n=1 Tax=Andrena cerasifolii TaxID=2819439 RepID=UPI0040384917